LVRRPRAEIDYPEGRELLEYINTLPLSSGKLPNSPPDEYSLAFDIIEADIIEAVRRSAPETAPETGETRTGLLPSTSTGPDGAPGDNTSEEPDSKRRRVD